MLSPPKSIRISPVYCYGTAVSGVVAALAVRFALNPYVGARLPFIVFYFVIVPSAFHLGVGPSLLTIFLSAVSALTFFVPSNSGVGIAFVTDVISTALFVAVSLVIVWSAEGARIARRRLEAEVIERVRAEATILEQVHQAEFGRDIGLALTSGPTLATVLDRCAALTVVHLGGSWSRIDTVDASGRVFEPRIVGRRSDLADRAETSKDEHQADLLFRGLIGRVASERQPFLTNRLIDDSGSFDRSWAIHEGMVALAGCPLVVEDRLIGVWTLFSRDPLPDSTLKAMEPVASALALGIERKRAEENLRIGEARKTAILETSLDGIITIDHEGVVVEFNPAAERIFGVDALSVKGRVLSQIIIPERLRDAHRRGLAHYLATGEAKILDRRIEVQAVRGDGTEFSAELAVARIPIDGPPLFTAHIRDIGDRKRFEEALRSSKEDAEEANQAKDRFIAVLSHELRTPLNPISLTINSILKKAGDDPELRQDLESIRHYVGVEARLIDNLLDVMRIARGKMPLRLEPSDAHLLMEEAVASCAEDLSVKSLKLTVDLQAERHQILADPNRLRQVFWNLIKNAAKFTPIGGSITLRSRNEAIPTDNPSTDPAEPAEHLVIEVSDDGIGIEPAVLPRIFEAFQQGESSINRRFGGLGLGLAICNGVVRGHGGNLAAQSGGQGQGTTFTVRLRTLAASPEPATAPVVTSPRELIQAPRPSTNHFAPVEDREVPALVPDPGVEAPLQVLVVEDEPATIRLMSRLIRSLGYQVTTAVTLAEASSWVEGSKRFDLIVSDIGLPDGTGLDLMRRVRATREGMPGIALTGFGTDEDIEQSRLAGFSAHMTKPIDFSQLETLIRKVVRTPPTTS